MRLKKMTPSYNGAKAPHRETSGTAVPSQEAASFLMQAQFCLLSGQVHLIDEPIIEHLGTSENRRGGKKDNTEHVEL